MSSNGSTPRSPRPVAMIRRHAVIFAATGSLIVGVLAGLALDNAIAAGQPRPDTVPVVQLADLADPTAPPVVTDTMGEQAAKVLAFFDAQAAAARAASAPRPAAQATSRPSRPSNVVSPDDPTVWDQLAKCETGNNWATDSVPGFSGGLGFANGTWTSYGGDEFAAVAADATREQQIVIAQRVQERQGWGAWPGCSALLGLR